MSDVMVELKQLRLHGIVGDWVALVEQGGNARLEKARCLVEQLQDEVVDRGMRSVKHQMHPAVAACLFPRRSARYRVPPEVQLFRK